MSRRKTKVVARDGRADTTSTKPSTARDLFAEIQESGLIGMWKDRDDIGDGGGFARKLRKQASRRKVNTGASVRH